MNYDYTRNVPVITRICRKKETFKPLKTLGLALSSLLAHHLGTVILGALLIPLLRFPRLMFAFLRKRMKLALASSAPAVPRTELDGVRSIQSDGTSSVCLLLFSYSFLTLHD